MLRNTQTGIPWKSIILGERQPIVHSCKKKDKKIKYRALIKANIQGNTNTETKRVTNTQI